MRSRVTRAKVLRRRAREAGARRTATAATVAAVSLAGGGASIAAGVPTEVAEPLGMAAGNAGVPLAECHPKTGPSRPDDFAGSDGTLFFTADDGMHGEALWKSNGTRAGTALVKDIDPADDGFDSGVHSLTDVGKRLFFVGRDRIHGDALWKSDGTRAGTVLVKDVHPERGHGFPGYLTGVGGTLFFTAEHGSSGPELWTSDGTKKGTVLVEDIDPVGDHYDSYYTRPRFLTEVAGTLFFTVHDGIHDGRQLWKSDGTKRGTVLVKDISRDSYGPYELTDVAGTLFFTADDGTHGRELWKSDGTKRGTVLVKDIGPNDSLTSGGPYGLTGAAGTLFFTADDGTHGRELWSSDGTRAGTVMVRDIDPEDDDDHYLNNNPFGLTGVAGALFFAVGGELWTSDGTEAGTVLVKDIDPTDGYYSRPSKLTDVGGTLFFTVDDGIHGRELWTSDGTEAGTILVKDIDPNSFTDGPSGLTEVGKALFFAADDGVHGRELWTSDGTEAGTILVKDIKGPLKVASTGQLDTDRGTLRVKVFLAGRGRLVVGPATGSRLREVVRDVTSRGSTSVILRPTRAGMRILRQDGRLPVKARFTFTPCDGTSSSLVREYTLRLR